MLVLASASPRRAELLRAAGIQFRVVVPVVEETVPARLVRAYAAEVKRAALAKAESVRRRRQEIVLGADTIVVCRSKVLGKPANAARGGRVGGRRALDARRMLALLSGRWHAVYTGLALVWDDGKLSEYERTEVAFRRLSREEINRYVKSDEPMDKAGAYAIQGEGAALVRAVRGCYTNVIGLPIPRLIRMLEKVEGRRACVGREGGGQRRGAPRK